jgi:hypothetical protein
VWLQELIFVCWLGVAKLDEFFPSFAAGCNSLGSTSFLCIIFAREMWRKVSFAQILASRVLAFWLSLPTDTTITSGTI